ncbi:MAG: DNA-binding protein [Candidatus Accumulibacter sp.]|jgi:Mor family transcriptional regulator|nr:DNA-binding protein [Accumulibacter sp.]
MDDLNFEKDDFRSVGPELLTDLAAQCARVLKEIGLVEGEIADQAGYEVARAMAEHWGGQNIYFPKALSFKCSRMYLKIYSDFTGNNHMELARRYGMSMQWIYRIVKTMRQADIERRQGDLALHESYYIKQD